MSDTSYAAVSQRRKIIDTIDEKWLCDCLSDDEIDIPKDIIIIDDEDDEDDGLISPEDRWTDLGLDKFTNDTSNSNLIQQQQQQQQQSSSPQPQAQAPPPPTPSH
jgi:hypothetical protein